MLSLLSYCHIFNDYSMLRMTASMTASYTMTTVYVNIASERLKTGKTYLDIGHGKKTLLGLL